MRKVGRGGRSRAMLSSRFMLQLAVRERLLPLSHSDPGGTLSVVPPEGEVKDALQFGSFCASSSVNLKAGGLGGTRFVLVLAERSRTSLSGSGKTPTTKELGDPGGVESAGGEGGRRMEQAGGGGGGGVAPDRGVAREGPLEM